jgi:hypothetical protein
LYFRALDIACTLEIIIIIIRKIRNLYENKQRTAANTARHDNNFDSHANPQKEHPHWCCGADVNAKNPSIYYIGADLNAQDYDGWTPVR